MGRELCVVGGCVGAGSGSVGGGAGGCNRFGGLVRGLFGLLLVGVGRGGGVGFGGGYGSLVLGDLCQGLVAFRLGSQLGCFRGVLASQRGQTCGLRNVSFRGLRGRLRSLVPRCGLVPADFQKDFAVGRRSVQGDVRRGLNFRGAGTGELSTAIRASCSAATYCPVRRNSWMSAAVPSRALFPASTIAGPKGRACRAVKGRARLHTSGGGLCL